MRRNGQSTGRAGLGVSLVGICVLMTAGLALPSAGAEVIYETDGPFGGPFGLWGFDVFVDQSVGVRFVASGEYTLDRISVWFMNNDGSGGHPPVTVTLRDDRTDTGGVSIPGDTIYETWTFDVSAVGWNPVLEVLDSMEQPRLETGVKYWIVAESDAPPALDGVWNIAAFGTGFTATTYQGTWQPGGSGAVVCTIVEATPVDDLPGDLDGDGDVDLADLATLLANYGMTSGAEPEDGDLDGDGDVDLADLAQLLANYGIGT